MIVSFCVVAYNEEKSIGSLFHDICAQTYPHSEMEVVLVNSMSTDSTRDMMERFADEDNGFRRVVVVDNPKKLQAAGWNVAIQEAKGDVILRIDAHVSIPHEFVEKNIKCIEAGEDVVGGARPNIADEDTPWRHTLLLAESSMFGSSIAPFRKSHHKQYVKSVFHGAYRRSVFEKAGMFNEKLGRTEDNEMHYRIRKAGYRICYNPDIISYQHTRNTWKGMIRQKYGNGYWIGLTLGVCPECFSTYHFVPICFVLGILLTLFLTILGHPMFMYILWTLYMIINIFMSVFAVIRQKKHWQYLLLPVIFLSLHLSYGVGTLVGVIRMPYWKKKVYEVD